MIRGTTPRHTFTIPFDTDTIKEVRIIYAQGDEQMFVKETADCTLSGRDIIVTLSQEETLKFDASKLVQIQVRVLTDTDSVLSSDVMVAYVGKCLDTEVMA